MGNDKTEEADRADDCRGDTRQQYGDHRNDDAASGDIHAEASRRLVLQRQQVTLSRDEDRGNETYHHIPKQGLKIIPGLHGDVGVDDARHAGVVVSGAGVKGAHKTGEHSIYRHTYKDDA